MGGQEERSNGVKEYWSGVGRFLSEAYSHHYSTTPPLHHSTTPPLHHSTTPIFTIAFPVKAVARAGGGASLRYAHPSRTGVQGKEVVQILDFSIRGVHESVQRVEFSDFKGVRMTGLMSPQTVPTPD